MILSLDTETTGIDLAHGAAPFIVTWCETNQGPCLVEWDVDPLTRRVRVVPEDVAVIRDLLERAEVVYLQNAKFDARALMAVGLELPWPKVRDTLVMGHLLASNHGHRLEDMCWEYIGADAKKPELLIKEVTQKCRAIAKRDYPDWRIADEGDPCMPSVKSSSDRDEDKPWKNDMWLPRAMALIPGNAVPDTWLTACARYAASDSEHTLYLGLEMERLIRERGLWAIYQHRLNLPRVACEMECYGVTAIGEYTESTIRDYGEYVAEAGDGLVAIAAEYGHDLQMAKGAALNDNMREFFYGKVRDECLRCGYSKVVKHWNGERPSGGDCPKCARVKRGKTTRIPPVRSPLSVRRAANLALPVIVGKKSGNASLDKDAMQEYLQTLTGKELEFIKLLMDKRKHDTSLTYMEAYKRFWLPVPGAPGFHRIHPSLNPCGTDHLRWASNSPNLQNVGKQEMRCEECDGAGCEVCDGTGLAMLSARNCFGPAPGREWWSLDFESIEKRIPAYVCMEPALIEIFEKPDEQPYWGSDHNLICSLLWPHLYNPIAHIKGEFKKRYINEYKRAKNTNFAKQYGAGRRKVDATAGVVGAYDLIDRGMPRLAQMQADVLRAAERTGFVETLPDRSVDPTRGYPILASRTEDNRVLSTTPFNYHVSGTACWVKNTALVRCSAQCDQWRAEGFDARVSLEIHDEILFDFPRGEAPKENLWRALILKSLMERSGADLVPTIPTPVSVEYHPVSWAIGVKVQE